MDGNVRTPKITLKTNVPNTRSTMEEPTPREVFLKSVDRCVAYKDFVPAFYDRFLGSSEEVARKFRFTDFEQQNKMLARSLELCAGATSGDPEALAEIQTRAKTHDRDHLDIEPRLYSLWLDAIISTASEFDPQWTDVVESAWRRILGHVVEHMTRKY